MAGTVPQPVIRVAGIRRVYARTVAVDDVSFEVEEGEIFGLIGPNGAGKTTTMECVEGVRRPDRGAISVLGLDPVRQVYELQARIGVQLQEAQLQKRIKVREAVALWASLYKTSVDGDRLLAQLGLIDKRNAWFMTLSGGQKQRLFIALALINDPELVFLDEPMSGLDPIGRHMVKEVILDLRSRGRTVFFSTHILADAESLCDRVGLLRGGRLVTVGRLDEILRIDVSHLETLVSGVDAAMLERLPGLKGRRTLGERWSLEVEEGSLGAVIQAVQQAGGRVLSVQPVRESLEDYFLREMGKAADRPAAAP
jgi:ABC-2 type transport system ATP-binding protein